MSGSDKQYSFKVEKTSVKKKKPTRMDDVLFGSIFSDHMFIMDYNEKQGWHDGKIVPFGPIAFNPSTAVFHYAQGLYEGMKAYRSGDGRILLFRTYMNAKRLNLTARRMCIPPIDEELFVAAVRAVVDIEREWVPHEQGTSLYIRPFIIATGEYLGLKASSGYRFFVILSPVASYYINGMTPTSVYIENEMSRSVVGGTGAAKCIGNYAPTLLAENNAREKGSDQVLWLDGSEHKYVEEMGAANVFFVFGDKVITPSLEQGTVLAGITRDSVIHMLRDWGISVTEERFGVEDLFRESGKGPLTEAFTTGTAAVVSPIGELLWNGQKTIVHDKTIGPLTKRLYDALTGIQYGKIEDKYGWVSEV